MTDSRLWCSDLGNGTFQNPILYADYSDPDVCRVGDTFYMTASSFNYIPGLPILVSKDLVNWELKNYAIKEAIPYEQYNSPAHAKGIWAPSIRYHNGEFFIFVGMPDEGIFVLKTKDPLGEWSEPHLILSGKGYIDPCPIWNEDGTAYVVHGYAKSRIGFKSILGAFQMTADGEHRISEDTFIYDGTKTNPTIEGPKVYKRNGYFYIFAPAGGVKTGWQTVLRSKNLYGPFEEKIVMHQGGSDINGPHQGGLVDTPSGEEWFIHFQDAGVYGRITHMQPIVWKNDWPVIGKDVEGIDCGEPQHVYPKPTGVPTDIEPTYLAASDDFNSTELGLQWQWLANSKKDFYSLTERLGALRLYSVNSRIGQDVSSGLKQDSQSDLKQGLEPSVQSFPILWNCANVLTQKLVCPAFSADFSLDISGLQEKGQAGILMIGGEYSALAFRKEADGMKLVYFESETKKLKAAIKDTNTNDVKIENILHSTIVNASITTAVLRIIFSTDKVCQMYYRLEGENEFTKIPFSSTPKDHTWVGAKIGVFSSAYSNKSDGYVDVTDVTVRML